MKKQIIFTLLLILFFLPCLFFSKLDNQVEAAQVTDKGITAYVTIAEKEFVTAKAAGVKTIRIMLMDGDLLPKSAVYKAATADRTYYTNLKRIKQIIAWGKKYNIQIILNIHEFPGRVKWSNQNNPDYRFWLSNNEGMAYRTLFINTWARLVTDLKVEPNSILRFELLNEPEPSWEVPLDQRNGYIFFMWDGWQECKSIECVGVQNWVTQQEWEGLQDITLKKIRSVEDSLGIAHRQVVVAASYTLSPESLRDWGSSGYQWTPSAALLADGNVTLAMHTYEPKSFTLQPSPYVISYTGTIDEVRQGFSFIKEFQTAYSSFPVLITEFGTVNAQGADVWISQIGTVMDELNIGGLYHSTGGEKYFKMRTGTSEYDIYLNNLKDPRVKALIEYLSK